MAYFTQDYIDFFSELAANNEREWFHARKKRYEKSVKDPFTAFVAEMINRVQEFDPAVQIEPKQAIFRIHRDVRFGKDKSPYKTSMSAVVSAGGRKEMLRPGLYLQVGAEGFWLAGGVYGPGKELLYDIRTEIVEDPESFQAALDDPDFKKYWGGDLPGEKNKRLPKEFQAAAESQPLIYNKSFHYSAELGPEWILREDLADKLMEYWHASASVKNWLVNILDRRGD